MRKLSVLTVLGTMVILITACGGGRKYYKGGTYKDSVRVSEEVVDMQMDSSAPDSIGRIEAESIQQTESKIEKQIESAEATDSKEINQLLKKYENEVKEFRDLWWDQDGQFGGGMGSFYAEAYARIEQYRGSLEALKGSMTAEQKSKYNSLNNLIKDAFE